jgi:3-oxoacyl-(acyl-carrier-protein) synthase
MMKSSVYIREAVSFCSLGNRPETIAEKIHDNTPHEFKEFLFGAGVLRREYRSMSQKCVSNNNEFYAVLEQLLSELIQKSKLQPEELSECALLIGSTSMNVPCSESFFREKPDQKMLSYIGYGKIGDHLCELFDIGGEVSFFTTACTSSANALLYAQRSIASGRFKRAIVIGFEFYNELTMSGFEVLGLLSSNGCRPFDANRSGIILGEGCSAILVDSIAPEYPTQFVLRGGSSVCDIASPTSHSVDGEIISQAITDALKDAKKSLNDVVLIKAHATGTENNDWAEGNGINLTFNTVPPIIGLKPFLGHTLGGSGAIELSLLWFCMREGFIPRTDGFESLDERMNISPSLKEQEMYEGVLLLNHFGFGGSGVVLVVECQQGGMR